MKRRDEVLVGLTTTLAIIAGVVGSLWLARGGLQPGYPLYAKFTWGAGLKQGQPVLLSGVNIGYVDRIELKPDGFLVVELRVRKNFHVPVGTTATIEPNGFFGDQLVGLRPNGPNPLMYAKGDTLLSGHAAPQIGDVLARADTIAANIVVLTAALRKTMVETDGFADFRKAARDASTMLAGITRVVDMQNAELMKTQAAFRHAASAVDSAQIDSTLRSMRATAASVTTLATDLQATTAKLNATIAKISDGDGTAGKLLNDAGLYTDVRALVTHIDSLTADFKKNPRKYIKLSIF